MAGHSKWSTIKRKKGKTDAGRAKVFSKVGREISVAVRESGSDPKANSKLREAIAKAKALNVPSDNIERAIKKADTDKTEYEQILYEGYGPCGVALMVNCLTDNRNRTAGDLRHYFDKYGGNLGQSGCVGFLFERKGILMLERHGQDEAKIMEDCLDAGALDFEIDEDEVEVITQPEDAYATGETMEQKGYTVTFAGAEYIPSTRVKLDEENIARMEKLLELLDDNDDVQALWHNWEEA